MIITKAWRFYEVQAREKNPFKTKMATAGFLFGLGDLTCQFLIEKKSEWDSQRTMRQGFVAMFMMNPCSQLYMKYGAPKITIQYFVKGELSKS